jgi:mono/diheme cytochrome c family protein
MLNKAKILTTAVFVGVFLMGSALAVLLQSDAELAESMPEGEGKAMVTNVCTTCHSLGNIVNTRGDRDEWEQTVNDMIARGAQIFPDEMETIVGYLAASYGYQQTASAAPSVSSGQQLFQQKCFQCHGDTMWRDLRQDRRSWEGTLYRMVGRGALWTEEEIGQMADYLASSHGPQ